MLAGDYRLFQLTNAGDTLFCTVRSNAKQPRHSVFRLRLYRLAVSALPADTGWGRSPNVNQAGIEFSEELAWCPILWAF